MRTKSTLLNMLTSYIGQISSVLVLLVSRVFFIKVLGDEYLGLNGLFSNILTLLSLVELGIGPAIIYSLYKPIANDDKETIKSLMNLYKNVYTLIGLIILILGISLTPFLSLFIKEMPDIPNLKLIYVLFVISSSVTYFYNYKRSLIQSDKNRYILPIYKYGFIIITNIFQILFLLITKNYIVFLLIQILCTIIENILVNIKANKMYPYLKEKNIKKLDKKVKNKIIKNTKAMVLHKLGAIVVRSTDNIIISKFVSLVAVGLYSNYYLVISAFENVSTQFFSSITAAAGNLYATESSSKIYEIFKKVVFINFVIYFLFTSLFLCLLNPFITLWVGESLTFDISIVIIIVVNIYLSGMRKSVLLFRDAMGLYYEDRYKPIFESIINIVASIILAKYLGVLGVFIGTTISTITTSFWVEPYILYKHGLKQKVSNYFKKYTLYTLITFIISFLAFYLCSFFSELTVLNIVIRLIISIFLPIISVIILFRNKEEYKYTIKQLKQLKRIVKK